MPYSGSPWFPPRTRLFKQGATTYEMQEDLGPGHHGERVLVALKRVKGQARGKAILKALPLPALTSALRVARQRLEEEVQLATYLHHPNIATVHGMHKAESALYVITECVTGCSLNTLVDVAMTQGRYFPESFMLYVGTQVAGALAHAHACRGEKGEPLRIVHRAIDPVRIRLTLEGEVKLTDFGLASARLPGQPTRLPGARGEVYWASPEALLGQPEDARSDSSTDSGAVEQQHEARWGHRSVPVSPRHEWWARPFRNLDGAEGMGGKEPAASGARPSWNGCSAWPEYAASPAYGQ
jgi:serine/threonine protein kinase